MAASTMSPAMSPVQTVSQAPGPDGVLIDVRTQDAKAEAHIRWNEPKQLERVEIYLRGVLDTTAIVARGEGESLLKVYQREFIDDFTAEITPIAMRRVSAMVTVDIPCEEGD